MLCEISQTEKATIFGSIYMKYLEKIYLQRQKVDFWLLGNGGWGEQRKLFSGTEFLFGNILELGSGNNCTT